MGKSVLEPKILTEAEYYIENFIIPNMGRPFSVSHNLNQATANVISQLLYSKRFDYDDERINSLIAGMNESLQLSSKTAIMESLPFGKYFAKKAIKRLEFLRRHVTLPAIKYYIDESKETLDREQPRDLIDRYFIHSETADEENKKYFSGKCRLDS